MTPGWRTNFEYLWKAHALSSPGGLGEDRGWSPEPPQPSSEEDEEEVRYLTQVLDLGSPEDEDEQDEGLASAEAGTYTEEGAPTTEASQGEEAPHPKGAKRRKLRKKATRSKD
jgi:hypothetical protein